MVIWNKAEESKIIWNTVHLLKENKSLTILQAIREAQNIMLPKERHRVISGKMKDIIAKINQKLQEEQKTETVITRYDEIYGA